MNIYEEIKEIQKEMVSAHGDYCKKMDHAFVRLSKLKKEAKNGQS